MAIPIIKSPYLSKGSTDSEEIWQSDEHCHSKLRYGISNTTLNILPHKTAKKIINWLQFVFSVRATGSKNSKY